MVSISVLRKVSQFGAKRCAALLYNATGELCLLSALLGENRDIFFPKLSKKLHLITFSEIATHFLRERGYRAFECLSENDARDRAAELIDNKKWPCYFNSDTTGEKDFEEFFTDSESLDLDRFETIGVVQNKPEFDQSKLDEFVDGIHALSAKATWKKMTLLKCFIFYCQSLIIKKLVSI